VEQFNLDVNASESVNNLILEFDKVSFKFKEIINDENIYSAITKYKVCDIFNSIGKFISGYRNNHDKLSEINYLADDLILKVGQKLNISEKNCLSEKLEEISFKSINFLNFFSSDLDSIFKNKCSLESLTVLDDSKNNSLASEDDLNATASQGQIADQSSSLSMTPSLIQASEPQISADSTPSSVAPEKKADSTTSPVDSQPPEQKADPTSPPADSQPPERKADSAPQLADSQPPPRKADSTPSSVAPEKKADSTTSPVDSQPSEQKADPTPPPADSQPPERRADSAPPLADSQPPARKADSAPQPVDSQPPARKADSAPQPAWSSTQNKPQLVTYPAPEKPKPPIDLLDYKVKFGLQDDPNEEPNSPLIFVHLIVKDIKKNISQLEWSLYDNISSFSQISASHKDFIEATFSFDNIFQIIGVSTNKYYKDNIGFKIEPMSNDTKIYMSGECPQGFDGMLNFKIVLVALEKFVRKSVPFYIAPDPKTLWNDLPVGDYAGYEYPDEKFEGTKIALIDKNLTVASCRGRSHAHVGKPRDDNYHFVCDSNSGWNILAVADGAGSAVFSRKGSDIACQSAVGFLHKTLAAENVANFFDENHDLFLSWKNDFKASVINDNDRSFEEEFRSKLPLDNIIYKCVYEAWSNINKERTTRSEETNNEKVSLNDYNTTLLFTAFKKFDFGYFFMSFWIGDGGMAIVDVDKTGRVLVLGSPDSGEFAGQTRFLTTKGEIDLAKVKTRTYFSFADDFESVILVTDGITDPYFPSDEMVGSEDMWKKFWTKILRYGDGENPGCSEIYDKNLPNETRSEALRKWLDFWSKGNHDDRTILIVN
jgi:serine/threonine protein phosphatase PrpC